MNKQTNEQTRIYDHLFLVPLCNFEVKKALVLEIMKILTQRANTTKHTSSVASRIDPISAKPHVFNCQRSLVRCTWEDPPETHSSTTGAIELDKQFLHVVLVPRSVEKGGVKKRIKTKLF
jgi:hypothetical protein